MTKKIVTVSVIRYPAGETAGDAKGEFGPFSSSDEVSETLSRKGWVKDCGWQLGDARDVSVERFIAIIHERDCKNPSEIPEK